MHFELKNGPSEERSMKTAASYSLGSLGLLGFPAFLDSNTSVSDSKTLHSVRSSKLPV